MKLVNGDAIWTRINKIPNKYTYLSEDIKCEVAIIGGGLTGAICSYYFSEAGIDSVLIEKNIIGYESTSASTSILQYEIDSDLVGLSSMIGEQKAIKAFKLCENAVHDIEQMVKGFKNNCDFSNRDCFYYTNNKDEIHIFQKEYEKRLQNGFEVEFIDNTTTRDRFSFDIAAGIYSKESAAEIDPYKFTHELISQGINHRLKVYENTEVTKINNRADEVLLITNNGFKIKAKKIIIATGFPARLYAESKIVNLTRSFTIATEPVKNVEGWYNRCIIRDYMNPYTYIRSTADNRILIGGEDVEIANRTGKAKNAFSNNLSARKYKSLYDKLITLFPSVKGIKIDYKFSGIFGDTNDSLPYIGEMPGMKNCYFCLGYGANGILYAIIGAKMLRDLYYDNSTTDLDIFRFYRKSAILN